MKSKDKILDTIKAKYNHLITIYSLTRDIELALADDERMVAQNLMTERGVAMENATLCDAEIQRILKTDGDVDVYRFTLFLKGDFKSTGFDLKPWFEEFKQEIETLRVVWLKTVEIDKRISTRVMGKNSYYNK